jgi:hypothetical protein
MRTVEKRVEMVPKETFCEVATCDDCGAEAPSTPGKLLAGEHATRFEDGIVADLTGWFFLGSASPTQNTHRLFCPACGGKRL